MKPCEQEGKIDAYLMGKLSQADSDAFEDHYFNCPACFQKTYARNELVDVIKHKGARIFAPEEEAREARRRAAESPKVPVWNKIAAFLSPRPWVAVAAAAAVLGVVILGVVPRSNPSAPVFSAVEDATVRGASVETISPAGALSKAPAAFSWQAAAGAAEYGISLFKGSELIWSASVREARAALPADAALGLEPGVAYAWQVKAYSAEGTLLAASARTEFSIAR